MDINVGNGTLELKVDGTLYSESVVFKTFYWYTGNGYDVAIEKNNENLFYVRMKMPEGTPATEGFVSKIRQDLIDFKLRAIVAEETKSVRELIIAKAFAHYPVDLDPTTDVSDPVGFNPNPVL